MLTMPEIMDHPKFSVARKKEYNLTAVTLLAPNQKDASVDKIDGSLEMFFDCVGALFYVMNKDDVQVSIAAMKASGNSHIPLGDVFINGNNIQLRTYAVELAGMAAIGVVHFQLADPATAPPPEFTDYFYAVAKHGLDSAISFNPLRAMKLCALLSMYNIVFKATVALAYIELGLSLPRNHKISLKQCPPDWSLNSVIPDVHLPQDELDIPPEDMIRRECVKVSIIKASLLRRLPTKAPVHEDTILEFRGRLSKFHARLPHWIDITATFRPVIYYVHLFYLSAMMLLLRRLIIAYIPLNADGKVALPTEARRAIEEGYQAAELNASVMDLMLQEGKVVQVCWLCINTPYTAGVMIAHKASRNALNNKPFVNYLALLGKCIGVLRYCAIKDALKPSVSGGAGAVGTVVGKAILESGGDVVFVDVSSPSSEAWSLIQGHAKSNNTLAIFQTLDVQDEVSITSAFTTLRTTLRHPIRGLVSCAAISGESDACDYPIMTFRKILDINVSGTFLIARAVANELHATSLPGSIVLFASISGHISNHGINTAAYNASKAAVHQLARSLAAEWGHPQNTFPGKPRKKYPPIRVNTISPGHIDTPLSAEARKRGLTEEWARQNMLGRISVPEEFRAPVLFLLSEGSSYVTGADLRVDGGHCAW
ncbi:hypothetical protein ACET3X_000435 [Alternaria dauci]|uniref:Uncharacterized protein n=1 Tax=Alternaria dauci TaxID=48095 RepID=A0ABR3UUJ1_9PLEO